MQKSHPNENLLHTSAVQGKIDSGLFIIYLSLLFSLLNGRTKIELIYRDISLHGLQPPSSDPLD